MKIHFSIDDVIGCFLWLTRNDCDSIFESYVFKCAKDLYEMYGIHTTCNCMYSDGINNLSEVSGRFKTQFQENNEWLKFSFHCYGPDSNYKHANEKVVAEDFQKVIGELERITGGGKSISNIVRLHFFQGSAEVVEYLREQGIEILLTADDERGSYDLCLQEEKELSERGLFRRNEMTYIRTDFRVEREQSIQRYDKETLVLFTHECFMGDVKIRDRLCEIMEVQGNYKNL